MMRPLLLAAIALSLTGCAHEGGSFPSLAPRAAEKQGFAEPAPRPVPTATPDPALDARVVSLDANLSAIARGAAADQALAERLATAARGRPVGSDAWLDAQSALARLDDWRAQVSSLASDVEELGAERAATLAPGYPALDALTARVSAEATRQGEVIERLSAQLPSA
ncbi:hypothetical protein [Sphingomonas aerophila]|jgi:hypothetical protein|uniref:Uncharacterized protein n=1 Tax=Sphingomonas aerophila TaxID=1344948 RepID=A0A7W9ET38_9SPHN|nr:hypothetical protein [Sphingomonas aerophila]MBB5713780.1 hypothetical protein [Sphingomonas aerophila]